MKEYVVGIEKYSHLVDVDDIEEFIGDSYTDTDESRVSGFVIAEIIKSIKTSDSRDLVLTIRRKNERGYKP